MGRLRRRSTGGYVVLDALVALAIALVGLVVFLGSLNGVTRIVAAQRQRVTHVIEERNADAKSAVLYFQGR
ncbi:MAG TPA: hypothetical protein VHE79_04865 [Spirochaetia bacterium]